MLWTFHQNHRFCCIFTMCRDTFSEKSLFHFKPSQVSFVLILSSLLGCLQARHAFIFPRNTTWPKNDVLLRRKTCALLRAKTSALLRRKTCAVLRARTCALFRAKTESERLSEILGNPPGSPGRSLGSPSRSLGGLLRPGWPQRDSGAIWAAEAPFVL